MGTKRTGTLLVMQGVGGDGKSKPVCNYGHVHVRCGEIDALATASQPPADLVVLRVPAPNSPARQQTVTEHGHRSPCYMRNTTIGPSV